LLKALLDCLDSGHVVPEEDDVTVETAIISWPQVWPNAIQCMLRWRHTAVCKDHVTCVFCDSLWRQTTIADVITPY
jgi:hypothetical protein